MPDKEFPIFGVGASAGGLEALNTMLRNAPADIEAAFIVILHLDPNHESQMAELLDRSTSLVVRQARENDVVQAGHVYVIPPAVNMTIRDRTLHLAKFEEPRGLRRPIDDFFKSLAVAEREHCAGVILSGTGADGSVGLPFIKECGGLCVAQEPHTARYDSMPNTAIATGAVDIVAAPEDIVQRLQEVFRQSAARAESASFSEDIVERLGDICAILRDSVGHDFSHYKKATLARRVQRRMHILNVENVSDYIAFLHDQPAERQAVFRDLLINVTRFFRNSEYFEILQKRAIEPLVASLSERDPIRVWVPACSTGEEAYTIAMLLLEAARRVMATPLIQIFATDISESSLEVARLGIYPIRSLSDVPEAYQKRYFTFREGGAQVTTEVRDLVRFSQHNVLRDPAFSRLDLFSCRNLLIYFDDKAQAALLSTAYYALRPGGFLFLGPSESIGRSEDLFSPLDQKARLFRRRDNGAIASHFALNAPALKPRSSPKSKPQVAPDDWPDTQSRARQRLLERYTPAYIVVDDRGSIIASSGRLGRYLDVGAGSPTMQAVTLARRGLREPLARLIRETRATMRPTAQRAIEVHSEFGMQKIDLVVDMLEDSSLLVVFQEAQGFAARDEKDFLTFLEPRDRIHELEEELEQLRARLNRTVEELESTNEELKSSNEEMMSMNEELQSTNEELATVNDELKSRVEQLAAVNDDVTNFLSSTDLALVVVNRDLHIRTFTAPIRGLFPISTPDIGRNLNEITNLSGDSQILPDTLNVIRDGVEIRRVIWDATGQVCYQLRIMPYRRLSGVIDGATLTFADVTQLQKIQESLQNKQERLNLAMIAGGMGVWDFDVERKTITLDAASAKLYGDLPEGESPLTRVLEKLGEDDRMVFEKALVNAKPGEAFLETFCVPGLEGSGQDRWIKSAARIITDSKGGQVLLGVAGDVTTEYRLQERQKLLIREINHRVKNLFSVVSAMLRAGCAQSNDAKELARDVGARINALARAHSLTQLDGDVDIFDISALVGLVLEPYIGAHDIIWRGDDVNLPQWMITPIGLILHEWATNAAKYGALHDGSGKLEVTWRVEHASNGEKTLSLTWDEHVQGNLAQKNSERPKGFGSRLVQASTSQLGGKCETQLGEAGFCARLSFVIR